MIGAVALSGCGTNNQTTIEEGTGTFTAELRAAVERAVQHIDSNGSELALRPTDVSARSVLAENDGQEHVRFGRAANGLRVLGGDLVVHGTRDGAFLGFSAMTKGGLDTVDTAAALSPAEASARGAAEFAGTAGSASAELIINARGDAAKLAYEVVVPGLLADGSESVMHYLVDAQDGSISERWDENESAQAAGTGKGFFNGTFGLTVNSISGGYELRDPSRGSQYTINMNNRQQGGSIFTSADTVFGDGTLAAADTVGADAQYGTGVTWDYYKNVHGRNGIANDGKGAYNRVHYSRRYNNAYWSDSCFCMTYGDGDGTTYNPFDSLDVAGHEMTHGVTSRSANLTYSGESGGLNEATSDIFGTMVEYYAANANDVGDYKIGEKLYKSNPGETKALRYMYKPSLDGGRSPDCYSSTLGSLDVHYSSGVANHFFFLLAEGSNGSQTSPTCNGSTVSGIGRDAAGKIWYRALTVYMTSSTNYAGARQASLKAAADLYGSGSANYNAVAAAWSAVSVN